MPTVAGGPGLRKPWETSWSLPQVPIMACLSGEVETKETLSFPSCFGYGLYHSNGKPPRIPSLAMGVLYGHLPPQHTPASCCC